MRVATSDYVIWRQGLAAPHNLKVMRERGVRPAVGFSDPQDVLKDPHLTIRDKREILCSWASDCSSVRDEPTLRWLCGTPEPVPLSEVQEALDRLDRLVRVRRSPPPSRRPHRGAQASISQQLQSGGD